MLEFMLTVGILSILFWVAYKVTGALFKACVWLFILVPVAILLWGLGILFCCTLILIPIGIKLLGAGWKVLLNI